MCEKLLFTLFFNCSFFFYYSFTLVHYSCPMNNAPDADLKKKKKKAKNAQEGQM